MAKEEVTYAEPSTGIKKRSLGQRICNKEKGEFLGRTPQSWIKILIFYMIFYAFLAAFFAVMLFGFFQTLDFKAPKQRKMQSLLKNNPGMGFRPMSSYDSTLIKYKKSDPKSYEPYLKSLNDYFKALNKTKEIGMSVDCKAKIPEGDEVCDMDLTMFENTLCTQENQYGFPQGKPCVLLKINKIFDWQPKPFTNESKVNATGLNDPNYIAVTCDGEGPQDFDVVNSTIIPESGFPVLFFPYTNQPGYQNPFVFAQFEVSGNYLIQIFCKMWAENIFIHKNDRSGSVHFELQIDE